MTTLTLGRAVAMRELRPSPSTLGVVAACVLAAAAFGRHLAGRGLAPHVNALPPMMSADALRDMVMWRLGGSLALPFVLAAAYLTLARVGDDEAEGWLAPLAAGGASRGGYLVSVIAGVAGLAIAAYLLAVAAFVAGIAAVTPPDARSVLRALTGAPPLILSAAAYGALCVVVARRRGRALALALAGVLVPAMALTSLSTGAGGAVSDTVSRLLTLHLPPWSWSARPQVVLQHAAYSAVAIVLAARLARLRLGRNP